MFQPSLADPSQASQPPAGGQPHHTVTPHCEQGCAPLSRHVNCHVMSRVAVTLTGSRAHDISPTFSPISPRGGGGGQDCPQPAGVDREVQRRPAEHSPGREEVIQRLPEADDDWGSGSRRHCVRSLRGLQGSNRGRGVGGGPGPSGRCQWGGGNGVL